MPGFYGRLRHDILRANMYVNVAETGLDFTRAIKHGARFAGWNVHLIVYEVAVVRWRVIKGLELRLHMDCRTHLVASGARGPIRACEPFVSLERNNSLLRAGIVYLNGGVGLARSNLLIIELLVY